MKISILLIVGIIIIGAYVLSYYNVDIDQPYNCVRNYKINGPYYAIENNQWGKGTFESLTQCIYKYSDYQFGWTWERLNPPKNCGGYVCPTYPWVMIGAPWGVNNGLTGPTVPIFPTKVRDIQSWTSSVYWNYPVIPSGGWFNFAYDIYMMDGITKKENFMIWIYNQGTYGGTPGTVVTDGINTYKWYRNDAAAFGWPWSVFVLQNQSTDMGYHRVDIKKLIDFLKTVRPIDDNWIIHGYGLGNEIAQGVGEIKINSFSTTLNGTDLG